MLERIDQELKHKTKTNFGAVEPRENWRIETQKPLRPLCSHRDGDEWWINRIPDIALRHHQHEILVEVKIDAGLTYRDDISQTKAYGKYLERASKEFGVQTALVALTRWRNRELEDEVDVRFSFKDLADWLEESSMPTSPPKGTVVELALEWAKFIRSEEWVMPDITSAHLDALGQIRGIEALLGQLSECLQEAVNMATERAATQGWVPRSGRMPRQSQHWGARQVWGRELTRTAEDSGRFFQLGCQFGDDGNAPSIVGLLFARGYAEALDSDPRAVPIPGWPGGDRLIKLSNLLCPGTTLTEQLWDKLAVDLADELERHRT